MLSRGWNLPYRDLIGPPIRKKHVWGTEPPLPKPESYKKTCAAYVYSYFDYRSDNGNHEFDTVLEL